MLICGSVKYRDLGAFPVDPDDVRFLEENMRDDAMNFYVRLFNDDDFKTVVLLDNIVNLSTMWRMFRREKKKMTDDLEIGFIDNAYRAFLLNDPSMSLDVGKLSVKILCMHYLKGLRDMTRLPAQNCVGLIIEAKKLRVAEYCYCQFNFDEEMKSRFRRQ